MDRRELLKTGAVLGTAAIAGTQSACATVPAVLPEDLPSPLRDMDEYLARLDADLAEIGKLDVTKELDPEGKLPALPGLLKEHDDLAHKAARTLYLTATFRDLSEEERLHPGVQARMRRALPEMDEAVFGMMGMLSAIPEGERARLQKTMRENPALVQRAVSVLEDQLGKPAVEFERRRRLQAATHRFAWQMQHQSLSSVIDECVEKARRAAEEAAFDDPRWLAARIGEEKLRRYQELATRIEEDEGAASAESAATGGEAPDEDAVPDEDEEAAPAEEEQVEPERPPRRRKAEVPAEPPIERPGRATMQAGARTMGIGAIGAAAGLVLIALGGSSGLGAVGMIATTIGGIVITIGLLIVILGAIARANG